MRGWIIGCGLVMVLCTTLLVRACEPGPGASYVRLLYPEPDVPHAPTLTTVRIMWSGQKIAYEEMRPGQTFPQLMYPRGGGGEMTVLFDIDGVRHAWTGNVGERNEGGRFGVEIRVDPLGTIKVTHCRHPCPGSQRPWYEPYRTLILQALGID